MSLAELAERPLAAKRDVVTVTDAAHPRWLALTKKGRGAARRLTRAHMLLQADAGATQEAMAAARPMGRATVVRISKRFVAEGLEAALRDRPRPGPSASSRASRGPS